MKIDISLKIKVKLLFFIFSHNLSCVSNSTELEYNNKNFLEAITRGGL